MITAIIPTFRRPTMLASAVRSTLSQTWPDLHIGIFDNASGDETSMVAASLAAADDRVRYHCHDENIGSIANFSFGVRSVETPFFSILADDDVLLPGFYERAMRAFQEYPGAMFVALTTLNVDQSGNVLGGTGTTADYSDRFYRASEAYGRFPWNWTGWVFRREVVDAIGFVAEAGPAVDIGFLRHVTARFPGVIVTAVAALIRVHPGSSSSDSMLLHFKADRRHWEGLSRSIEADALVPASIRSSIRGHIEKMYVTGLRRSVPTSLIDGKSAFAIETTRVLRRLGYPLSAGVLRAAIACHDYLPPVAHAVHHVGRRRRRLQAEQQQARCRQFESRRREFLALLEGMPLASAIEENTVLP